jgi:hypothetical protein
MPKMRTTVTLDEDVIRAVADAELHAMRREKHAASRP